MATISNLIVNLIARTSVFEKGMRRSSRSLYSLQHSVYQTQRRIIAFGKAFLTAGAIYRTIHAYAEFEKQLANVSTMLNEHSMRLMPAYTAALKRMAIEYGEGTETLSKGLYDILSASVAPEKALSVLDASVRAAKAGMTDTAVAADAITTILNSYGMSADQAGRVSDILFGIIKRGKTTFAELGPNIGKVAAIAATAGLSLEELGASIATLTRAGLQTEIAVTALRSILNAFLKPTKESIEVAAKFGIELNTATLRTIGLVEVLKRLRNASAEQLAQLIPNTRGLAGFAAALKQTSEMSKDLEIMLNSAGMTQEAYEKTTDTLSHSLNQAREAFKILTVEIGEKFRPVIDGAAKAMAELAGLIQEKPEGAKGFLVEEKRLRFLANLLHQIANTINPLRELQEKIGMHKFWRTLTPKGALAEFINQKAIDLVFEANEKLREYNKLIKKAEVSKKFLGLINTELLSEKATRKALEETIAYNEQLIKQDQLLGMVSESTYLLMSRNEELSKQLAGMPTIYTEEILKMGDEIYKFTQDLQKQIELFGLSGLEKQARDLTNQFNLLGEAERNALQPQIDRMNKLIAQYDALEKTAKASEEARRREEDISRKIEDVISSTMTPLEKYEKRIGELNDLLERGLPWENYSRAIRQAREELEGAADEMIRFHKQAGEMEEIRLAYVAPAGLHLGTIKPPKIPKINVPDINIPKVNLPDVALEKYESQVGKLSKAVQDGALTWQEYADRLRAVRQELEVLPINVPMPAIPKINELKVPEATVPAMTQPDMVTPIVSRLDTANEHLSKGVMLLGEIARKESLG